MAEIHHFGVPPRPRPVMASADLAAAALLVAVRLPGAPADSFAEVELAAFSLAVQRLEALSPVDDAPDAHEAALMDHAMILAQLAGHLLSQLDDRRMARAIPLAVAALADATHPTAPPRTRP